MEIATDGENVVRLGYSEDDEPARLVSLVAAGRLLGGLDEKTVRTRIADGDIEGIHIGRRHMVFVPSIDAYVERLRDQARARRAARAS